MNEYSFCHLVSSENGGNLNGENDDNEAGDDDNDQVGGAHKSEYS